MADEEQAGQVEEEGEERLFAGGGGNEQQDDGVVDDARPSGDAPSSGSGRKRWRPSKEQREKLTGQFAECSTPTTPRILEIASEFGLNQRTVRVWFQNRRQRMRSSSQSGGSSMTGGSDATYAEAGSAAMVVNWQPSATVLHFSPPSQSPDKSTGYFMPSAHHTLEAMQNDQYALYGLGHAGPLFGRSHQQIAASDGHFINAHLAEQQQMAMMGTAADAHNDDDLHNFVTLHVAGVGVGKAATDLFSPLTPAESPSPISQALLATQRALTHARPHAFPEPSLRAPTEAEPGVGSPAPPSDFHAQQHPHCTPNGHPQEHGAVWDMTIALDDVISMLDHEQQQHAASKLPHGPQETTYLHEGAAGH
ncbi:homeobox domain-containing protein [Pavlovales sp. CCMP2436]|nr:homeobox domain-containing protein [Pavlovales sp. CCMP2436]